jgi:hypothetical protein
LQPDALRKLAQRLILVSKRFLAEMAQEWQRLVEDVKGQKVNQDFRSPMEVPGG